MNSLSERLALALKESGMSQVHFARACGIKPPSVSNWLNGKTKNITGLNLLNASRVLGVRQEWLATGKGPMKEDSGSNVVGATGPARSYEYPEISEVQAGNAAEAIDLLQPGQGTRHQSDAWAGDHGFWLKVRGDSMTRSGGVSFPEGMLVLVAPGVEPVSGQYIVAKIGNDVTFKQYVVDAGVRILRPLNSAYPTQVMDEKWQLVGTVMDAKWPKGVF